MHRCRCMKSRLEPAGVLHKTWLMGAWRQARTRASNVQLPAGSRQRYRHAADERRSCKDKKALGQLPGHKIKCGLETCTRWE